MQTSPSRDRASDPQLASLKAIQAQASLWTVLALGSVFCAANLFLGIVAAILGQIARRAAARGDLAGAHGALRWARLLTMIGVGLFALAALACIGLVVYNRVP